MNAKKTSFKEGFTYETVLNGFSATVKADDLEKLLEIEGVTLVEPIAEVHAYEDPSQTGGKVGLAMDTSHFIPWIEDIWNKGIEGQGIKVAVLDTGIDYHHPEFADIYKGGLNFMPHNGRITQHHVQMMIHMKRLHLNVQSTCLNLIKWHSFYTSHGTHVAGTIAAIGQMNMALKELHQK